MWELAVQPAVTLNHASPFPFPPAAAPSSTDAATSPLAGKTVVVVGAGGAGRALAFGAAVKGASVVIANRSVQKAQELAAQVRRAGHCSRACKLLHARVSPAPPPKKLSRRCSRHPVTPHPHPQPRLPARSWTHRRAPAAWKTWPAAPSRAMCWPTPRRWACTPQRARARCPQPRCPDTRWSLTPSTRRCTRACFGESPRRLPAAPGRAGGHAWRRHRTQPPTTVTPRHSHPHPAARRPPRAARW